MRLIVWLCATILAASPALGQGRETLGVGRLFTNDFLSGADDRWRTGAYSLSIVRGYDWNGRAPTEFGSLLEYRLRTEIMAPEELGGRKSADRIYVGAITAGLHTHFTRGNWDFDTGVDLVIVGPQTGLSGAQDWFHDLVSAPSVSSDVQDGQLSNAVYPTLIAQASYNSPIAGGTVFRPFIEGQLGAEDFVRVGADVMIGQSLRDDLWLRDATTGHLYAGVENAQVGYGFIVGADYTFFDDSAYFPADYGVEAEDERFRIRAGFHETLGRNASYFYGLTYLSEEYVGQREGQVVGSLKFDFNF